MDEPLPPDLIPTLVASHERFLAFLSPRVGGRPAAEEILQAAFVKGIEHGAELREAESAIAWFYRLLRNAVVDHHRRRAAEARALARAAQETPIAFELDDALEAQLCGCVKDLVPTLKPEYAEILQKVDLEGMAVPDVARALGTTPNNAAVRLHRARQALKRQLERTCGSCTEHACLDCTCKQAL